jgi:uncharacterized protein (DUF433 family)
MTFAVRNKDDLRGEASLTSHFGRVVHCHVSGPYIRRNGVDVHEVLRLVEDGYSDQDICKIIPRLEIKDVMACKAYQVRFLSDTLSDAYHVRNGAPFFLLDENVSYMLLPEVFRMFGRSTHVYAEGLYFTRNDDEHDVWKFAVENGFKAVLTQDDDFRGIAKRHRARLRATFNEVGEGKIVVPDLPAVIMPPAGSSHADLVALLARHRETILSLPQQETQHATYRMHEHGFDPRDPDFALVAA